MGITEAEEMLIKYFAISMINQYDLSLEATEDEQGEKYFVLKDLQNNGKLIDKEARPENLMDVIDMLDTYHEDYIYKSLEERQKEGESISRNDWDYLAKRFIESNNVANILETMTASKLSREKDNINFSVKNIDLDAIETILDKIDYPLINTYVLGKEKAFSKNNFFNSFTDDTLKYFEDTLKRYYILGDISKDVKLNKFTSKSNKEFSNEILLFSVLKKQSVYDFADRLGNMPLYGVDLIENKMLETLSLQAENKNWVEFEENEVIEADSLLNDMYRGKYPSNEVDLKINNVIKDFGDRFNEIRNEQIKKSFPFLSKIITIDTIKELSNKLPNDYMVDFEDTARLYDEGDIVQKEGGNFYSKGENYFNIHLLQYAEGLITKEDFISDMEQLVREDNYEEWIEEDEEDEDEM